MWHLLVAGLAVSAPPAALRLELAPDAALTRELVVAELTLRLRDVVQLTGEAQADFVLSVGASGATLRNRDGAIVLERPSDEALPEIRARELALAVEAELRVQLAWNDAPPPAPTVRAEPEPPAPATPPPGIELGASIASVWPSGTREPELGLRGRVALRTDGLRPVLTGGWNRGEGDYQREEVQLLAGAELAWGVDRAELGVALLGGVLGSRAAAERAVTSWHPLVRAALGARLGLAYGLALRFGLSADVLARPPEYLVDGVPLDSPGRARLGVESGLSVDL